MKLHGKILAAGVLVAVTLWGAPAAFASNTLSVDGVTSPAGDVPMAGVLATSSVGFLSDYGVTAQCSAASLSGTIKRGATVVAGNKIGAIDGATFRQSGSTSCTTWGGLNLPVVIEKSAKLTSPSDWGIYAVATPAKGATTVSIEIRDVALKLHSTGSKPWSCDLEMIGTLRGVFNQTTQQISIYPASGVYPLALTAFDGSGTNTAGSGNTCGGQFYTGDMVQLSAAFNLATPGIGGIHF